MDERRDGRRVSISANFQFEIQQIKWKKNKNYRHRFDSDSNAIDSNYTSDLLATNDNHTQTEIIYTVFVNGIPVLAKIAANDVQLMSDAEVANILDMGVHTKAERKIPLYCNTIWKKLSTNEFDLLWFCWFSAYLKEPQATPLIPSSTVATEQSKPILAIIFQNPYILAFILVLIMLIILLLMLLMLVSGGQKKTQTIPKKG